MAGEKFFLFQREPITAFSATESNTGDGLSVIAIPAHKIANVTAKLGKVVFTFTDAGIYQTYGGSANEGLPNVRIEVSCDAGSEVKLIEQVLTFISKDAGGKSIMRFDAVTNVSSFPLAKVESTEDITPRVPKQPVVLATGSVSNDPADTDITSTTTNTIDEITFTTASLKPIIDYNSEGLSTYAIGDEIGQTNHWHNAGTGGNTYQINANTGDPILLRAGNNGLKENAVEITASENLILDNAITIEDDYTMYMVIGLIGYGSLGHNIVDGTATHIGFAAAAGEENTNNEFWVRHETAVAYRPALMQLDNTAYDTSSYTYPDPLLENGITGDDTGQTCYVFVLRRDKDYNLYLHNHTGQVVGYVPAKIDGKDFATDGDLKVTNVGTGFRGTLQRIGVIPSDIGASEGGRIARDLFDRYRYIY